MLVNVWIIISRNIDWLWLWFPLILNINPERFLLFRLVEQTSQILKSLKWFLLKNKKNNTITCCWYKKYLGLNLMFNKKLISFFLLNEFVIRRLSDNPLSLRKTYYVVYHCINYFILHISSFHTFRSTCQHVNNPLMVMQIPGCGWLHWTIIVLHIVIVSWHLHYFIIIWEKISQHCSLGGRERRQVVR